MSHHYLHDEEEHQNLIQIKSILNPVDYESLNLTQDIDISDAQVPIVDNYEDIILPTFGEDDEIIHEELVSPVVNDSNEMVDDKIVFQTPIVDDFSKNVDDSNAYRGPLQKNDVREKKKNDDTIEKDLTRSSEREKLLQKKEIHDIRDEIISSMTSTVSSSGSSQLSNAPKSYFEPSVMPETTPFKDTNPQGFLLHRYPRGAPRGAPKIALPITFSQNEDTNTFQSTRLMRSGGLFVELTYDDIPTGKSFKIIHETPLFAYYQNHEGTIIEINIQNNPTGKEFTSQDTFYSHINNTCRTGVKRTFSDASQYMYQNNTLNEPSNRNKRVKSSHKNLKISSTRRDKNIQRRKYKKRKKQRVGQQQNSPSRKRKINKITLSNSSPSSTITLLSKKRKITPIQDTDINMSNSNTSFISPTNNNINEDENINPNENITLEDDEERSDSYIEGESLFKHVDESFAYVGLQETCSKCNFRHFPHINKCKCVHRAPPMQPLHPELYTYYNTKEFNKHSRALNYLFSFSTLCCSPSKSNNGEGLFTYNGGPSNIVLHGKTMHIYFPITKQQTKRGNGNYLHYMINDPNSVNIEKEIKKKPVRKLFEKIKPIFDKLNPLVKKYKHIANAVSKGHKEFFVTWKPRNTSNDQSYSVPGEGVVDLQFHDDNVENPGKSEVAVILSSGRKTGRYLTTYPISDEGDLGKFESLFSRLYEPLQFPLFFPKGDTGWGSDGTSNRYLDINGKNLSMNKYYKSRIYREEIFTFGGRLLNEYICDAFSRVREKRLNEIRNSSFQQVVYRKYEFQNNDPTAKTSGKFQKGRIYVPSSFTGSIRNKRLKLENSLNVIQKFGNPTLFIIMTTNGNWVEIKKSIKPWQNACDRPDVTSVVFKHKYSKLLKLIREGKIFGRRSQYIVSVIEWQKRGYPHCHILVRLEGKQPKNSEEIDKLVQAVVPNKDTNPVLHELVNKHMIHKHIKRHCGCLGERDIKSLNSKLRKEGKNERYEYTNLLHMTKCKSHFPKPLCHKTKIDEKTKLCHYKRNSQEDQFVVSYNSELLRIFKCHINVDIASTSNPSYLFKYLHKPGDRARLVAQEYTKFGKKDKNGEAIAESNVDETKFLIEGEYISASQCIWRIREFHTYLLKPSVKVAKVHLPLNQAIFQSEFIGSSHKKQSKRAKKSLETSASDFMRYIYRPLDPRFDNLKFIDFMETYLMTPYQKNIPIDIRKLLRVCPFKMIDAKKVYNVDKNNCIIPGKLWYDNCKSPIKHQFIYARPLNKQGFIKRPLYYRLNTMFPSSGKKFFLRMLVKHTASRSFEGFKSHKIKQIDGTYKTINYSSYEEACISRGLFSNHNEFSYCMKECINKKKTPQQLRLLFCMLIQIEACASRVLYFQFLTHMVRDWEANENHNEDFNENFNLKHNNTVRKKSKRKLLLFIKRNLRNNGKKISDYGLPDLPDKQSLIEREFAKFDRVKERQLYLKNISLCNKEQKQFVRKVISSVLSQKPLALYLNAPAGRGKTFAITTAAAYLRSIGHLCVLSSSTGNTAIQFSGGRTAHKWFKIPFQQEHLLKVECNPTPRLQELLKKASFFVWDEITIANSVNIDAVDRMLRRVCDNNLPFGGKVFVFVGDNQQIPPVIPGGTDDQIINASFLNSSVYKHITVMKLFRPQRDSIDPAFSKMNDKIGKNKFPDIRPASLHDKSGKEKFIELPKEVKSFKTREEALTWIHPDISNTPKCSKNAVVCPLNSTVDALNDYYIDKFPGEPIHCIGVERCRRDDFDGNNNRYGMLPFGITSEFLESFTDGGIPPHKLTLKPGCLAMIIRNMDVEQNLMNGTRVIVKEIGTRYIAVERLDTHGDFDKTVPKIHLLPRIKFDLSIIDTPIEIYRQQFPLKLCYACSVHKTQGRTLDNILLDFSDSDAFTHGMLYVSTTRVSSFKNLCIFNNPSPTRTNSITGASRVFNVVFPALLNSTPTSPSTTTSQSLTNNTQTFPQEQEFDPTNSFMSMDDYDGFQSTYITQEDSDFDLTDVMDFDEPQDTTTFQINYSKFSLLFTSMLRQLVIIQKHSSLQNVIKEINNLMPLDELEITASILQSHILFHNLLYTIKDDTITSHYQQPTSYTNITFTSDSFFSTDISQKDDKSVSVEVQVDIKVFKSGQKHLTQNPSIQQITSVVIKILQTSQLLLHKPEEVFQKLNKRLKYYKFNPTTMSTFISVVNSLEDYTFDKEDNKIIRMDPFGDANDDMDGTKDDPINIDRLNIDLSNITPSNHGGNTDNSNQNKNENLTEKTTQDIIDIHPPSIVPGPIIHDLTFEITGQSNAWKKLIPLCFKANHDYMSHSTRNISSFVRIIQMAIDQHDYPVDINKLMLIQILSKYRFLNKYYKYDENSDSIRLID